MGLMVMGGVEANQTGGVFFSPEEVLNTHGLTDVPSALDFYPRIATNNNGRWINVWASMQPLFEDTGTSSSNRVISGNLNFFDSDIQYAISVDKGETWSDPKILNSNAFLDNHQGIALDSEPQIVCYSHTAGDLWVAVWYSNFDQTLPGGGQTEIDEDIYYSYSNDDGASWSDAVPVNAGYATDFVRNDRQPRLHVDGKGNFVVAWASSRHSGGGGLEYEPFEEKFGGPLGADPNGVDELLEYDLLYSSTPVVIDPVSRKPIIVGWSEPDVLNEAGFDPASGTLDQHSAEFSELPQDEWLDLASDPLGNWVAVWHVREGAGDVTNGNLNLYMARSVDGGHTWGKREYIDFSEILPSGGAAERNNVGYPQIETNGTGDWGLTYISVADGDADVKFIKFGWGGGLTASLNWGDAVLLTPSDGKFRDIFPTLASDGFDAWSVAWTTDEMTSSTIRGSNIKLARSVDNGVTFCPPVVVNSISLSQKGVSEFPALETDGKNNWIVVWHSTNDLSGADPPVLADLDIHYSVEESFTDVFPVFDPVEVACAEGSSVVNLAWSFDGPTTTTFEVYRSSDGVGGPFHSVSSLDDTFLWSDTSVDSGTTYTYLVRATFNGFTTAPSVPVQVATAGPIYAELNAIAAGDSFSNGIDLTWSIDSISSNLTDYVVERLDAGEVVEIYSVSAVGAEYIQGNFSDSSPTDLDAPSAPGGGSSTTPTSEHIVTGGTINVSWMASEDNGTEYSYSISAANECGFTSESFSAGVTLTSGVADYIVWMSTSSTPDEPPLSPQTVGGLSASFTPPVANGFVYAHIIARDAAGNESTPRTIGPWGVGSDRLPPAPSIVSITPTEITPDDPAYLAGDFDVTVAVLSGWHVDHPNSFNIELLTRVEGAQSWTSIGSTSVQRETPTETVSLSASEFMTVGTYEFLARLTHTSDVAADSAVTSKIIDNEPPVFAGLTSIIPERRALFAAEVVWEPAIDFALSRYELLSGETAPLTTEHANLAYDEVETTQTITLVGDFINRNATEWWGVVAIDKAGNRSGLDSAQLRRVYGPPDAAITSWLQSGTDFETTLNLEFAEPSGSMFIDSGDLVFVPGVTDTWIPFASSSVLELKPTGLESKTLYTQFRDAELNYSIGLSRTLDYEEPIILATVRLMQNGSNAAPVHYLASQQTQSFTLAGFDQFGSEKSFTPSAVDIAIADSDVITYSVTDMEIDFTGGLIGTSSVTISVTVDGKSFSVVPYFAPGDPGAPLPAPNDFLFSVNEPGPLVALQIEPSDDVLIAAGDVQRYTATGSDAAGNIVTVQPVWSSDAVGAINKSGTLRHKRIRNGNSH